MFSSSQVPYFCSQHVSNCPVPMCPWLYFTTIFLIFPGFVSPQKSVIATPIWPFSNRKRIFQIQFSPCPYAFHPFLLHSLNSIPEFARLSATFCGYLRGSDHHAEAKPHLQRRPHLGANFGANLKQWQEQQAGTNMWIWPARIRMNHRTLEYIRIGI